MKVWFCTACALSNCQSTAICLALYIPVLSRDMHFSLQGLWCLPKIEVDLFAATKKILNLYSIFVVMRYVYWGRDRFMILDRIVLKKQKKLVTRGESNKIIVLLLAYSTMYNSD